VAGGDHNTVVGATSGDLLTTGDNNTFIGYGAGGSAATTLNVTCLGYEALPSGVAAQNEITLGNASVLTLRCNDQVINALSDARDKADVVPLTLGLDFLNSLRPVQFNWDRRDWYDDGVPDGSKKQAEPTAGFIAQDLDAAQQAASADWLNVVYKANPDKLEAGYARLLPVIVKAAQELAAKVQVLEAELAALKAR
jgi:hypothetical protein